MADPDDGPCDVEMTVLPYGVAVQAKDGKWYVKSAFAPRALADAYALGMKSVGLKAKVVWDDPKKGIEEETPRRIWARFLALAAVEIFGEKETILEGKKVKNFLGSVERYKKLFDTAVEEVLVEKTLVEGAEDEHGRTRS